MIAIDTNILVYAFRADSQWHEGARRHIRGLAEGLEPWAIPWPCLHEFLCIVTHPRIFEEPSPLDMGLSAIAAWCQSPSLRLLSESENYFRYLRDVSLVGRIQGPRIHDARIAALCLDHGVRELWTADRDFSRFPALRTKNPLLGVAP